MKTPRENCDAQPGWLRRLVGLVRAPWKAGYAAGKSAADWRLAQEIRELRQHLECTEKCYKLNLAELESEVARRLEAEWKLKECRRYLRAANKGAERNALVAQLCAARAVNRRPPNASGETRGPNT